MSDRLLDRIEAILLRLVTPLVRFRTVYTGRVVAQRGDGSLDVRLDTDLVPGMTKIPPRYGVPDASAKVRTGARCLVGFANGNVKTPVVLAWEGGQFDELDLGTTSPIKVAREGDAVQSGTAAIVFNSGLFVSVIADGPGAAAAIAAARLVPGNVVVVLDGTIVHCASKVKAG
jgi:hypothetical protein